MKLVSGRIENFAKYSQFKSLEEFNKTIAMFLLEHKKDFTKPQLVELKRLIRYSAKYRGVANAKIATLLKAINNFANGFGISRSTFERMLKKAIELGIVTVKPTIRPKGGKGHNVYVFNKIDVLKKRKLTYCKNAETPTESKVEQVKNEGEAIVLLEASKNNNNHLNTKKSAYIKYVPKCLQHFQAFFGKHVKDIYSRVWLAKKKLNVQADQQLMQEIGLIAMNQLKQYVNEGKQLTDEERCKIAYKIGLNQLEQRFAVKNESANKDVQAIQDTKTMFDSNPYAHKKPVRTEMVPDWLNKETVTTAQTEQQEKTAISEERKKAIWEQVKKLNAGGDYDEQRY